MKPQVRDLLSRFNDVLSRARLDQMLAMRDYIEESGVPTVFLIHPDTIVDVSCVYNQETGCMDYKTTFKPPTMVRR